MKNKILVSLLTISLIFTSTSFIFANDEVKEIEESVITEQIEEEVVEEEPQVEEIEEEEEEKEEEEIKEEPQIEEKVEESIVEEHTAEEISIEEFAIEESTEKELVEEHAESKINTNKAKKLQLTKRVAEPAKTEEEIIETETITIKFLVLKPNGNYESAGGGSTINLEKGVGGTKTFTISAQDQRDVSVNSTNLTYKYLGTWTDDLGNDATTYTPVNGKIKLDRTSLFNHYKKEGQREVYVNILADYTPTTNALVEVNTVDYIAHGKGSWSSSGSPFGGYNAIYTRCNSCGWIGHSNGQSAICPICEKEALECVDGIGIPADIPETHQFKYWYCDWNKLQYNATDIFKVTALQIDTDTVINLIAMYQPAVIVNYFVNEELVNTVQSFESIQVYDYIIDDEKFDGWYESNNKINTSQIFNAPEISADGEYLIINVEAHFIQPEPEPEPEPTPQPEPTPTPEPTPEPEPTPTPTPIPMPQPEPTVIPSQPTQRVAAVVSEPVVESEPTVESAPAPKTTIPDSSTPKVKPIGSWALINLIATILSCLIAIFLIFVKKEKEDDEEEYTDEEKDDIRIMRLFKIMSLIFGVLSIIIFIFTEDMNLPMVLVDKWTLLMILLLIIEIVNIFIIRRKSKGEESDD